MKRLVSVSRWRDVFFLELHPNAKLLLSYLYDCADNAGFIDLHYPSWSNDLKLEKKFIETSLKALQSKLLSDKKKKLYIIDFLKHQEKLPLVQGRKEDDFIIDKLKSNLERFDNPKEIKKILDNIVKEEEEEEFETKRGRKKAKFSEPTFNEFSKYCLVEKPDATERRIKSLYDHYVSCGWKVGNKPMADWEAAIRVNIHKVEKDYKNNHTDKPSRTSTTLSVVDELKKNV
ncbi:MAG TPA: hypothetical protein VN026_08435 [Bacteroidia bacterium]|jgi:hypothetical protein|nr:hypothetical protein [Bacteroidia bacterium]